MADQTPADVINSDDPEWTRKRAAVLQQREADRLAAEATYQAEYDKAHVVQNAAVKEEA
jgi:hypothetical protein